MNGHLRAITSALGNRDGSVGVIFALSSVMLFGVTGTAIDFARASSAKSRLQAAVDAAAIAGASLPATARQNRESLAKRIFAGNLTTTDMVGVQPQIEASNAEVKVTASYRHKNIIMQTFGFPEVELNTSSTARSQVQNGGVVCLLALSPDAEDGLHLQGINKVASQDCWAWVNSDHPSAINAVGASVGTAQGFCSAGGVSGGDHFYPYPYTGCEPMSDPFKEKINGYSPNNAHICNHTNLELKSGTYTLNPGTYCGNTVIKPQADVTLNPGVYIMRDGYFEVQAGSTVRGEEVTLFFFGKSTRFSLRGGANLDLKAPKEGFFAGLVMVDRKIDWYDPSIRETVIQGGGDIKIEGVVYAAQWRINVSGNSEMNQHSNYFAMIADHFYMEGNGKLYVRSDADKTDLPSIMPKIKNGPLVLN